MMSTAPILLFVYNRPQHTRRAIASLLLNELASQSQLFIYSDAAKSPEQREAVEEVRQYIRTIEGFAGLHITEREENWGLARNIIEGVSEQIARFGKVIVLEDDLLLAPYFLRFMNDALETYKDEDRVGHIHACEFTNSSALPDTFLIKWTGSWGWATWARAWKLFNPDGRALLAELERRKLTYKFDFDGKYGYTRMLRRQTEGKNNSWAIRWNATLFLHGIFSLNAGKSLVRNIGFDGSGTHCGTDDIYVSTLFGDTLHVQPICPVDENKAARKAMKDYYSRTNSFIAKARRRVQQLTSKWKTN